MALQGVPRCRIGPARELEAPGMGSTRSKTLSDATTPSSTPLLAENVSDLLSFFREELKRACQALQVATSEQTEAYLVHLLDGFVRVRPEHREALGFERPAALMLGDALEAPPGERVEALRRLGDACLYNCGFFTERLTRRSVSSTYYERMGRDAYGSVSELMRRRPQGSVFGQIFEELAAKFDGVVAAFRELSSHRGPDRAARLIARIQRGERVTTRELVEAGLLVQAGPARG